MELDTDAKDEIKYLIQQEIGKAFNAALSAALSAPIQLTDVNDRAKQDERQKRIAVIKEIGNQIKSALQDLEDEANAKIVEKTDPARAEVIRRLKTTY